VLLVSNSNIVELERVELSDDDAGYEDDAAVADGSSEEGGGVVVVELSGVVVLESEEEGKLNSEVKLTMYPSPKHKIYLFSMIFTQLKKEQI